MTQDERPADTPSDLQLLDAGDGLRIGCLRHPPESPADDATPVVLLHGGGLDHRMWRRQLDAGLPRPLIALDARGHGWTEAPRDAAFRHGDDVVAALDALHVDRALLVGLSMGAATAVDAGLEHPDRVAGIVACGAGTSEPTFSDPWMLEQLDAQRRAAENLDPEAWIRTALQFAAGPHRELAAVDAEVVAELETMLRRTLSVHIVGQDGPRAPTPATPVQDTWERLGGLQVPVLGVVGSLDADDHLRMVGELVDRCPRARLVTVDAAAHYPPLERPEEFTATLREFLAALEA
ncbi:alpha/beta hydrolase [Nesterenkonia halobia]|uniref:Alpha/beta hydrolase n=1 Tax=Nesterenkonia halobia TaxID=37922 RepID=A0ABP6RB48_9MICC